MRCASSIPAMVMHALSNDLKLAIEAQPRLIARSSWSTILLLRHDPLSIRLGHASVETTKRHYLRGVTSETEELNIQHLRDIQHLGISGASKLLINWRARRDSNSRPPGS